MRILWLGLSLALGAASANVSAAPYWVAWEGSDYPENEGWTRYNFGDGPAVRTLADGVMTIDSLWSTQISDFYQVNRSIDPYVGEYFLMQWRVRVNEVVDNDPRPFDPGVSVFSDDDWGLAFRFGVDSYESVFEEDQRATYQPGVFHNFELVSFDMRSYVLHVDGNMSVSGAFWEPAVTGSFVAWGDAVRGAASLHDWDYFRFGVVPEPQTAVTSISAALASLLRLRNRG